MKKLVSIVAPMYNEEKMVHVYCEETLKVLSQLSDRYDFELVLVNDGSKDNTWQIIKDLHKENDMFKGIDLSRNRGHQNALIAGLTEAAKYADAVISLDADLQDDVNAIEQFIQKYYEGYDVVYGVRSSREKDSLFKKFTAESFYKLMKLLGVDIVFNHADYRLMSRRALEGLDEFKESNLFLRALVPEIGYPSTTVEYERNERFAGESKYPLRKMLSFAFDGVTSFSIKPIRMVATCGILFCVVAIILAIWAIIEKIMGNTVSGWASIMVSIWFVGGALLLGLGIVGEYIGKIYSEVKNRPRYIVKEKLY